MSFMYPDNLNGCMYIIGVAALSPLLVKGALLRLSLVDNEITDDGMSYTRLMYIP